MMPPTEARRFTDDDIRSALRNREMPLEALRYDVTPTGLHYLLGHFDIPALDPDRWNLEIRGLVARPQTFTLGELRQMPSSSIAVTLECAGNGRTLMEPFPGRAALADRGAFRQRSGRGVSAGSRSRPRRRRRGRGRGRVRGSRSGHRGRRGATVRAEPVDG